MGTQTPLSLSFPYEELCGRIDSAGDRFRVYNMMPNGKLFSQIISNSQVVV